MKEIIIKGNKKSYSWKPTAWQKTVGLSLTVALATTGAVTWFLLLRNLL